MRYEYGVSGKNSPRRGGLGGDGGGAGLCRDLIMEDSRDVLGNKGPSGRVGGRCLFEERECKMLLGVVPF